MSRCLRSSGVSTLRGFRVIVSMLLERLAGGKAAWASSRLFDRSRKPLRKWKDDPLARSECPSFIFDSRAVGPVSSLRSVSSNRAAPGGRPWRDGAPLPARLRRAALSLTWGEGLYAGVTSPAPVPASSPGSGRLSNTSSMRPKALASSLSRNLSRSIAFSISSSGWPVYLA